MKVEKHRRVQTGNKNQMGDRIEPREQTEAKRLTSGARENGSRSWAFRRRLTLVTPRCEIEATRQIDDSILETPTTDQGTFDDSCWKAEAARGVRSRGQ